MTRSTASLFETLLQQRDPHIAHVRMTKRTLNHLLETLESSVVEAQLASLIFLGLTNQSEWQRTFDRIVHNKYLSQYLCLFSPLPPLSETSLDSCYVELEGQSPLAQDWFLVLLTEQFHVLLCGKAHPIGIEGLTTELEVIWTFDPAVIADAVGFLLNVIEQQSTEQEQAFRAIAEKFMAIRADPQWYTRFVTSLVARIEHLRDEVGQQQKVIWTLLHSIHHGVYIIEVNAKDQFRALYLSPQYHALFGRDHPMTGTTAEQVERIHPDDRERVLSARMAQPLETSLVLEFRAKHEAGHYIWVEDTVTVEHDAERGTWIIYGMVRDITEVVALREREREQERLRLAIEKEREVNAIKSYFMTNISHEFRTPLAIILSASQLMERYGDRMSEEDRKLRFEQIHYQVMHLSDVLTDMTNIIHGNLNQLGFNPQEVDVEVLLKELVADAKRPIHLHVFEEFYGDTLGTGLVDAKLLKHIISNLISNAAKFSPEGGTITIRAIRKNDALCFTIHDEGIGIPANELDTIFDVFHRAQNAINYGGTGLGLYIAQACARLHGGTLTVTSELQRGSSFVLTVPIYRTT